jgi:hypothetical protein
MLFGQTANGFSDLLPQSRRISQKDNARGNSACGMHQSPEIVVFGQQYCVLPYRSF